MWEMHTLWALLTLGGKHMTQGRGIRSFLVTFFWYNLRQPDNSLSGILLAFDDWVNVGDWRIWVSRTHKWLLYINNCLIETKLDLGGSRVVPKTIHSSVVALNRLPLQNFSVWLGKIMTHLISYRRGLVQRISDRIWDCNTFWPHALSDNKYLNPAFLLLSWNEIYRLRI